MTILKNPSDDHTLLNELMKDAFIGGMRFENVIYLAVAWYIILRYLANPAVIEQVAQEIWAIECGMSKGRARDAAKAAIAAIVGGEIHVKQSASDDTTPSANESKGESCKN